MDNIKNITENPRSRMPLGLNVIVLAVLILSIPLCRVRHEPGKVWNPRGKIVELAKSLIGIPYKYGGFDLDGFDCSGFVYYVYDSFGIKLPRTAKKQAKLKKKVRLKRAQPADILAFKLKRQWHTAIYTGGNSFIHSPNKKGFVRKEKLNAFWKTRLKSVIRIIDE